MLFAEANNQLNIYAFNLPDIQGKMISFEEFKGKALVIVNVANNSSYTPQYAGLETLYEEHKSAGLVVLGFPSNDFGAEEPDSEPKFKRSARNTITSPFHCSLKWRREAMMLLRSFII